MASSLTHLILSDLVYEEHFSNNLKRDFMQGTLIPDIRYLDRSISRDSYHLKDITLEDVLAIENSFQRGMCFHALVDLVRDHFYSSKGIYTPGENEEFILALKVFEDQYFYHKIKNRNEYFLYFQEILYLQIPEIKEDILKQWYQMHQDYLLVKPNDRTRSIFMQSLGLSEEKIARINKLIEEISENKEMVAIVEMFYDTFLSLLENYNNIITINTYEQSLEKYITGTLSIISGEIKDRIDNTLSYIVKSSKILEIGTGLGRDADYIESLGFQVQRSDYANSFIEYHKKRGKKILKLDILNIDMLEKYDLIFANAVLLHFTLKQVEHILSNIYHTLNEGGIFAFSVMKGLGEKTGSTKKVDLPRFFKYRENEEIRNTLSIFNFKILYLKNDSQGKWIHIICQKEN